MKVKVNKTKKAESEISPDVILKIENINSIRFEDINGENTYIQIFNRKDNNRFIESYKTLNNDISLCPICGRFNNIGEECTCDKSSRYIDENSLIDLFEDCLKLPHVDIYVNDDLIKRSIA